MNNNATTPKTAHITAWDRAVVIALGGAGCALSYDALQQMAIAIHVRGPLTYLFPLVIDGFIAYGIRALLVLRNAPLRARLYVWTLFGMATAASIWANALHAVRLNEEAISATGLRLGDMVVAVLSTIAPLALAGAVHLYILMARRPVTGNERGDRDNRRRPGRSGEEDTPGNISSTVDAMSGAPSVPAPEPVTLRPVAGRPVNAPTVRSADDRVTNRTSGGPPIAARPVGAEPVTGHPDSAPAPRPASDRGVGTDTDALLEIARSAVRAEDKLTRKVVAQAIRGRQIPLSSDTLTALMVQLRKQNGQPVTVPRN